MSADAPAQTSTALSVRREVVDPGKPPTLAHHMVWTRLGDEMILEFGFFDFPEVVKTLEQANSGVASKEGELVLHVTHRIGIALPRFVAVMQEALTKIKEAEGK